jgi:uroporphyrinogen decarboxylase
MTGRELVRAIIGRSPVPHAAFWLGNPHPDTWPLFHQYFHSSSEEDLHRKLGSDLRWITPQFFSSTYRHPQGKGLFDMWKYKKSLGEAGPLSECETAAEIDDYDWPDPEYLVFDECLDALRAAGENYRASGFWCPFFHDAMDLVGVETMLMKMHTHPEVVHAVFRHICSFYLEANERFYRRAGDMVDGFFFGNDFGTQRDLFISPAHFDEFVLPWIQRLVRQAKAHGYQVLLHSCGSVYRLIDRFVAAGIECLHPLQARAGNMTAEVLAREWGGRLAFLGGVDTQELLVHGTPQEIRAEVQRLKRIFGPHYIVSPSHEALLPNIPPENVFAMAEEAKL